MKSTQTKEHQIIFSTPMVQAILDGRKTQTRRLRNLERVNNSIEKWKYAGLGTNPDNENDKRNYAFFRLSGSDTWMYCLSPYGFKGDLLWVREAWCRMDGELFFRASVKYPKALKWKPSIHMPKIAARLWLQIKDVRVERVRDISEGDAIAEGVESWFEGFFQETRYKDYEDDKDNWRSPYSSFQSLWISINGLKSWDDNPWVWVVEFERTEKPNKPPSP